MISGPRKIADGHRFNHLFPQAAGNTVLIKREGTLDQTINLMKGTIRDTLSDTRKIAHHLKGKSDFSSCASVWDFCFRHLQYRMDEKNKEQVRRPARTWRDRKRGVDCDCMTVFIGSILTNLGIPFRIRLSRNSPDQTTFGHVYPVAMVGGKEVIMDCVVHRFNCEAPYLEKKDITMELQYLNGLEGEFDSSWKSEERTAGYWEDAYREDLEGLDGKTERAARKQKRHDKRASKPPLKERAKNVLHKVNRINPATALLRAGVLASLKLNMMNVAGKLRYSYWSDAKAQSSNMDMAKFGQLKAIRQKIEKVFYGAGGKPENFREAILTGKGNRDKRVSLNGLGIVYQPVYDTNDLRSVIGTDIYFDEFDDVEHPAGINGLGEVTAGAAIAAASGIIGTIAGLLKKLGSLFKKGTPEQQQEVLQENTAANEEKTARYSTAEIAKYLDMAKSALSPEEFQTLTRKSAQPSAANQVTETQKDEQPTTALPKEEATKVADFSPLDTEQEEKSTKSTKSDSESGGLWQWAQDHPIIAVALASGLIIGTGLVIKGMSMKKKAQKSGQVKGLQGVKKSTPKKRKTTKQTTAKTTHAGGKTVHIRRIELS